jgi:hypothetical protein
VRPVPDDLAVLRSAVATAIHTIDGRPDRRPPATLVAELVQAEADHTASYGETR